MRITKSVVFSLMGLLCTVNATKATGKPVLAKRQTAVTVTADGCTAVCVDLSSVNLGGGTECDIFCDGGFTSSLLTTSTPSTPCVISIATSTRTSTVTTITKAALAPRTVTSIDFDDIDVHCEIDFDEDETVCIMEGLPDGPITTTIDSKPALNPRTQVSATEGDCKALCWDLKPGSVECDVQCSSDFKTKESAPSKATHVAAFDARENVQAHEVREARLARKFGGHVARANPTTVTVDIYPDYCTAGPESFISTTIAGSPTILPMQVPQKAGAPDIAAALSHAASAALSFAQATPSAASSALSEAPAFLSGVAAAAAPISANATDVTLAPTASAFTAPTNKSTSSAPTVLATTTARSTSSETNTTSATITPRPPFPGVSEVKTIASAITSKVSEAGTNASAAITSVVSEAGTNASAITSSIGSIFEGAASEYTVSTGLVLSLLVGLAANVAFLI